MFNHPFDPRAMTLTETRTFVRTISGKFAPGAPNASGLPTFTHPSQFTQPQSQFAPFAQSTPLTTPLKEYPQMPQSCVTVPANVEQQTPPIPNVDGILEKYVVTFEHASAAIRNPNILVSSLYL